VVQLELVATRIVEKDSFSVLGITTEYWICHLEQSEDLALTEPPPKFKSLRRRKRRLSALRTADLAQLLKMLLTRGGRFDDRGDLLDLLDRHVGLARKLDEIGPNSLRIGKIVPSAHRAM